jgi:hypothetical protein
LPLFVLFVLFVLDTRVFIFDTSLNINQEDG